MENDRGVSPNAEQEIGSDSLSIWIEMGIKSPKIPKKALPVIGASIDMLAQEEVLTQEQARRLLRLIPEKPTSSNNRPRETNIFPTD